MKVVIAYFFAAFILCLTSATQHKIRLTDSQLNPHEVDLNAFRFGVISPFFLRKRAATDMLPPHDYAEMYRDDVYNILDATQETV